MLRAHFLHGIVARLPTQVISNARPDLRIYTNLSAVL